MENYNFWQDFFSTYRSSPDAIKALWLIVPPTFVVAAAQIALRAFRKRPVLNITLKTEFEERSVQHQNHEEIPIFASGRLTDRSEFPTSERTL